MRVLSSGPLDSCNTLRLSKDDHQHICRNKFFSLARLKWSRTAPIHCHAHNLIIAISNARIPRTFFPHTSVYHRYFDCVNFCSPFCWPLSAVSFLPIDQNGRRHPCTCHACFVLSFMCSHYATQSVKFFCGQTLITSHFLFFRLSSEVTASRICGGVVFPRRGLESGVCHAWAVGAVVEIFQREDVFKTLCFARLHLGLLG